MGSQQFQRNQLCFKAQFLKIDLALQLYNFKKMQLNKLQLFSTLIKEFEQKLNIDQTLQEAGLIYFLKEFKLEKICSYNSIFAYAEQTKKYEKGQIGLWSDQWHKNQRKLFIEFLIYYCKLKNTTPQNIKDQDWSQLSQIFFEKNPSFLKFQGLSIIKNLRKTTWTQDDDKLILKAIEMRGQGNWNQISKCLYYVTEGKKYFAPKQIRERWYNHLCPNLKKDAWSALQDKVLLEHVLNFNKRWCQIVKELKYTRTQHMIKNRYKILTKLPSNSLPTSERNLVKRAINKTKKKILTLKKSLNSSVHDCNKNMESSKHSSQVDLGQINLIKNSGENQGRNQLDLNRNIINQELQKSSDATNFQQLALFGLYFPAFSQDNSVQQSTDFSSNLSSPYFFQHLYDYPKAVLSTEGVNIFDRQYLFYIHETYLPTLWFSNGIEQSQNGGRKTTQI